MAGDGMGMGGFGGDPGKISGGMGMPGGAAVSLVAYQAEYTATQEELNVIDATARLKKCSTPANWASTSAIR